jgi:hypothetical protein
LAALLLGQGRIAAQSDVWSWLTGDDENPTSRAVNGVYHPTRWRTPTARPIVAVRTVANRPVLLQPVAYPPAAAPPTIAVHINRPVPIQLVAYPPAATEQQPTDPLPPPRQERPTEPAPTERKLTEPTLQRVYRVESEEAWRARIRAELERPGQAPVVFPEEVALPDELPDERGGPLKHAIAEPAYVCYQRLPFERKNTERYGWEIGPIQPAISATAFYFDLLAEPLYLLNDPLRCYECSAGQCLPGDPVPLRLALPTLGVPIKSRSE